MDSDLAKAYEELEDDIRSAMRQHRGNKSLMSILLNTLLLYPDHPYGFDAIWARAFDPQTREYVRFLAATPVNLSEDRLFAKERALISDVSEELRQGRRCQIYATYTGEKDVTLRLETILRQAGFRVVVLRSSVPTEKREDWYERQLQAGVEVVVCHPKLVETGLDLLAFPTLYFYETGYSLHTLRQASRRSWRIGQRQPVRVKFVTYAGTMQETCLRLMGKKMLDEDLMSAMARELVEKAGVGDSADLVWRQLEKERGQLVPQPPPPMQQESDSLLDLPDFVVANPSSNHDGIHLLEPVRTEIKSTPWPAAAVPVQLSLFG
jgi:hypothetical protein